MNKFCKNVFFSKTKLNINSSEEVENIENCPKLFCHVTNKDIQFEHPSKINLAFDVENNSNFLVPGVWENDKFLPIIFEFDSLESEIRTFKVLCNTFNNVEWPKKDEKIQTKSYDLFNTLLPLKTFGKVKIHYCYSELESFERCKVKYKKFHYYDHKSMAIRCQNVNVTLKVVKGKQNLSKS